MFDKNGYPTDEALHALHDINVLDFRAIAERVVELWYYPERIKLYKYKGRLRLRVSTGGWSGNESVIDALPDSFDTFYFVEHKRGGQYLWETGRLSEDRSNQ